MTIDHEELEGAGIDFLLEKILPELNLAELFYQNIIATHNKMRETINEERLSEEDHQRTRGIAEQITFRLFERLGKLTAYEDLQAIVMRDVVKH